MGIVSFSPKQDGTGDPSPTNVRPIHPGLTLKSKNLFELWANGYWYYGNISWDSSSAGAVSKPIKMKAGDVVTLSQDNASATYQFLEWNKIVDSPSQYTTSDNLAFARSADGISKTYTVQNDCYLCVFVNIGTDTVETRHVQLELGSTTTEYEPYYDMEIYGGYVDFENAEVVETHKAIVNLGELAYASDERQSLGRFSTAVISGIDTTGSARTAFCLTSCYESKTNGESFDANWNYVAYCAASRLYIHDHRFTTASDLKTALVNQTLVYKLTTPTTYSLTASQLTQAYNQLVPVSPVMLARRRRMMLTSGFLIPPQYQLYDYLQQVGGYDSCIDTGVSGDDNSLRIKCTFMPVAAVSSYSAVFGNYQTENGHYCWRCILLAKNANNYNRGFYLTMGNNSPGGGGTTGVYLFSDTKSFINEKISLDMTYGACIVTTRIDNFSLSRPYAEKTVNTRTIAIGSSHTASAGSLSIFRYYTFKMWSQGKLIRDYRPCVRKSDNKAGFYDMVNHTFNPSIGSQDFIAGND